MSDTVHSLNSDVSKRISVDTRSMAWTQSPGGHVWRKRVHLSGPAESGQVTSVVQYRPGANFPGHDHPGGEEILVLEGVFSDEHGDWPAGTYLLNPEGFHHAPFSRAGCILFVKLRQFPGIDRRHVALQTRDIPWEETASDRVSRKNLYRQSPFSDHMRLMRWESAEEVSEIAFPDGAELFVLQGSFQDALGFYGSQSWLRIPAGETLSPTGGDYCELYIKEGGFSYLD